MWMDLEIIIQSEVSQKEKNKLLYVITYMWNLRYDTNELIYKAETDSQAQKTDLWLPKGKGVREINWEYGINRYTLPYTKQMNNRIYCIAQGTINILNIL